nr:GNAT family N-acetyltransferase [Staphylococcus sp. Marseille-Q5304]
MSNYENVLKAFKKADIIVYTRNEEIIGFCGLVDNYIAGMFVEKNERNQGIGDKLIKYLQTEKDNLSLKIYQQNKKAIKFYKHHNFKIKEETKDETQNKEYIMYWNK